MEQHSLGILPHRIGQMTFGNERLEVIVTFQRNLLPPPSEQLLSLIDHQLPLVCPALYLTVCHVSFILLLSEWWQKVPPECSYTHYKATYPRRQCSSVCSKFEMYQLKFFMLTKASIHRHNNTSGVPKEGVQNPPPKFRRPSKIVPNSTRLWKLKNCWI